MKSSHIACAAFFLATLTPVLSAAQMTVYKAKYPPTNLSDEINGSGPMNTTAASTSATLIASGMMGVKFFGNVDPTGKEALLKSTCIANSNPGNTWPDSCDFRGLATALSVVFSPQHWINPYFSNQDSGVSTMISAVGASYKSPVLIPIYGSTDHWVTVYEVQADRSTTPYNLGYVKYFDGGTVGTDPLDPCADEKGNSYIDGVKKVAGAQWKLEYYALLSSPPGCSPYCNQFVLSYEPPISAPYLSENQQPVSYGRFPGVLREGEEMNSFVAEERLWDSLFLAGVNRDPIFWESIEHGEVGQAFPVYGEDLDGRAMDYYLVPIVDRARGTAVAMVRLSMDDGSMQSIWVPTNPLLYMGVTLEEAQFAARELLTEGEDVVGGVLTWNMRSHFNGSDMMPNYEFAIVGKRGEYRSSIEVSLIDGRVRGILHSLPRHVAVKR